MFRHVGAIVRESQIQMSTNTNGVRYSSFGIATLYGLDGPGIESWWERDFQHPSRPALGPIHSPVQWVLGLLRG